MNNKTIPLFNYVYSCIFENEKEDNIKWAEFEKICLEKMKYVPYDFIMENGSLLTMNQKCMWQDLSGNKGTVGKFVILNFEGTKEYISYKTNEFVNLIKKYGLKTFDNLGNTFDYMCNEAIKEILNECQNKDLLDFDDSIFIWADNGLLYIRFDEVKIVMNKENLKFGNTIYITNSGQLINQLGDGNSATISHINDEQLFTLLEQKLEALKVEMKSINCEEKIVELENAIKTKDKKSILEIISYLAAIGSFIASGIKVFLI